MCPKVLSDSALYGQIQFFWRAKFFLKTKNMKKTKKLGKTASKNETRQLKKDFEWVNSKFEKPKEWNRFRDKEN